MLRKALCLLHIQSASIAQSYYFVAHCCNFVALDHCRGGVPLRLFPVCSERGGGGSMEDAHEEDGAWVHSRILQKN